ncbi:hypothetical protein A5893_05665 [Pedobacter psychrophilus]|uniref:DUF4410 domain-containing protein n=1 Tax=Pedobacter psychrophilus TaxID=1826909 RepID=A0A179DHA7_9SPHI|nr:hypothetical protein [Pedobacter psychrophilus]OAQ40435.1 hypothetical protein A5893_05665 [Pedobacter psychrophilus]
MKKYLFMLTVILGIALTSNAQESAKQVFESPKLKEEISKHKIVAILPFKVSIKYRKQPKNFNVEANRDQEKSMSTSIQSSMYTFLLRKGGKYTVDFQDVDKTNILLRKAGMLDKLDEFTKDEIAKVLGVDAVIGGTFESEQSKSEGGAIASAVLLGGLGGKTGSGTSVLTLNNGKDGELLWRFFKTMDDNIMSSTDDLVERMMRKISRNFPYSI